MGDGPKAENMTAPICVVILAHNEEARIAACLQSLPLADQDIDFHVVVNGSTDSTACIAQAFAAMHNNLAVHVFAEGGKARSWNRILFDELPGFHAAHVFVDGDAEVAPGSIRALANALAADPHANAVAGLPMNGRKVAAYQSQMRREHGLFGDLYALRGDFLARMKAASIRLPDDVVGDDGLVCALAKTDLADELQWDDRRVVVCGGAGFLCAPVSIWSPASWRMQFRRMINYSVRHFQNAMISQIMRRDGPGGLPHRLSNLYPAALPAMRPRRGLTHWLFDRLALRRMAGATVRG
jgi:glycosyltransferase involved in cell wall biosynthesis